MQQMQEEGWRTLLLEPLTHAPEVQRVFDLCQPPFRSRTALDFVSHTELNLARNQPTIESNSMTGSRITIRIDFCVEVFVPVAVDSEFPTPLIAYQR